MQTFPERRRGVREWQKRRESNDKLHFSPDSELARFFGMTSAEPDEVQVSFSGFAAGAWLAASLLRLSFNTLP